MYLSVFSPNAVKYGPEKTPYLDIFHAVLVFTNWCKCLNTSLPLLLILPLTIAFKKLGRIYLFLSMNHFFPLFIRSFFFFRLFFHKIVTRIFVDTAKVIWEVGQCFRPKFCNVNIINCYRWRENCSVLLWFICSKS